MNEHPLHGPFQEYIAKSLCSYQDFRPILAWSILNHKNCNYIYKFIKELGKKEISLSSVRRWRRDTITWLALPVSSSGPINELKLEESWQEWRAKYGYPTLEDLCSGWSPDKVDNNDPIVSPEPMPRPRIEPEIQVAEKTANLVQKVESKQPTKRASKRTRRKILPKVPKIVLPEPTGFVSDQPKEETDKFLT